MAESPAVLVRQFHQRFRLPCADRPTRLERNAAAARERLLDEETAELAAAVRSGRLPAIAQELADVVYVAYGTALAYGIDLDAVIAEVHRANMSKLGPDGLPITRDGKILKGPRFRPADIAAVLARGPTDTG